VLELEMLKVLECCQRRQLMPALEVVPERQAELREPCGFMQDTWQVLLSCICWRAAVGQLQLESQLESV
jgi:hypothetical protein